MKMVTMLVVAFFLFLPILHAEEVLEPGCIFDEYARAVLVIARTGPLLISGHVIEDVNEKYGTHYTLSSVRNSPGFSVQVAWLYLGLYATERRLGHKPTLEDMVRVFFGGPQGFKKSTTVEKWIEVRKHSYKKEKEEEEWYALSSCRYW